MENNIQTEMKNGVLTIRFDEVKAGWQQEFLLSSDRHHDSLFCKRDLEKQHLERAKERNAIILDGGDLFDAMQGKFDPRRSLDELRPEFRVGKYYDAILDDAVEFYKPYAENFLMIGRGNHETAVTKNVNIDLIDRLVHDLNQSGGNVHSGGYGGWIRMLFTINTTVRRCKKLKYYHGNGGDAPVTHGVIQTNRQAMHLVDADIVMNGHNHNAYWVPIASEGLTEKGFVYKRLTHFIRTPGYKDGWFKREGFDVEKFNGPKPVGAMWMTIRYVRDAVEIEFTPMVQ